MAKRALVVGVDNYIIFNPSGKANLTTCVNDARSMSRLLRDAFLFTEVYELLDFQASKQNIIQTLRHLINISEAGDSICFYFSGHGGQIRADLSQADCDMYYETLIPAFGGMISDRDLAELTEDLYPDAVNFTVITDSCFSGGMHLADEHIKCKSPLFDGALIEAIINYLGTLIPCGICLTPGSNALNNNVSNVRRSTNGNIDLDPDPNKTLVGATKATLLSACRFDELSWISNNFSHSIFTQCLIDMVDQSNFLVSYHNLIEHLIPVVEEKIARYIRPSRAGVTQTPQLFGQRNRMHEDFLVGWNYTPMDV